MSSMDPESHHICMWGPVRGHPALTPGCAACTASQLGQHLWQCHFPWRKPCRASTRRGASHENQPPRVGRVAVAVALGIAPGRNAKPAAGDLL